jgi:hypothetical protein
MKLSKDDVRVFIKKGGSKLNADLPYIRTEILFNSYYEMRKVTKAVSSLYDNDIHRSSILNTGLSGIRTCWSINWFLARSYRSTVQSTTKWTSPLSISQTETSWTSKSSLQMMELYTVTILRFPQRSRLKSERCHLKWRELGRWSASKGFSVDLMMAKSSTSWLCNVTWRWR